MAKKALLIGIHYPLLPVRLGSAYADVDAVTAVLADTLGFDWDNIVQMKDDMDLMDPLYPSRDNILNAFQMLVANAAQGDYLVFHFSGHGSQRDAGYGTNEVDGKDEAIWPADVEPNEDYTDGFNIILDDEIKSMLVDPAAKARASLVIILDCCHSGTGADLQYSYTDPNERPMPTPKQKLGLRKLTRYGGNYEGSPGAIVSWAACQDPHVSMSFAGSGGSFVKAFVEEFRANWGATHGQLLHYIKGKMTQEARNHWLGLQAGRNLTPRELRKLERWFQNNRPEPVLGVLYNENQVLNTSVLDTFGYGVPSGYYDAGATRGFDQDTDFGGDWQDGRDDGFGTSNSVFDQNPGFDGGWQNSGIGGSTIMANFAQDFQQDFSQDFGQGNDWF